MQTASTICLFFLLYEYPKITYLILYGGINTLTQLVCNPGHSPLSLSHTHTHSHTCMLHAHCDIHTDVNGRASQKAPPPMDHSLPKRAKTILFSMVKDGSHVDFHFRQGTGSQRLACEPLHCLSVMYGVVYPMLSTLFLCLGFSFLVCLVGFYTVFVLCRVVFYCYCCHGSAL